MPEMQAIMIDYAIRQVRRHLAIKSNASGQDILSMFEARAAVVAPSLSVLERAICRNCRRPLIRSGTGHPWFHESADGGHNRGCRAASYVPDQGWNETLSRDLYAQPYK